MKNIQKGSKKSKKRKKQNSSVSEKSPDEQEKMTSDEQPTDEEEEISMDQESLEKTMIWKMTQMNLPLEKLLRNRKNIIIFRTIHMKEKEQGQKHEQNKVFYQEKRKEKYFVNFFFSNKIHHLSFLKS